MPEVIRSIDIAASPASVWTWFSSQSALRQWWQLPDLEIDLVVGGGYAMTGSDGETRVTGVVLELEPERRLVLSWMEQGTGWLHPGRLLFTLEPSERGTRVTLQHDGFAGIGAPDWPGVQASYERGADVHGLLQRLAQLVANGAS